LSKTIRMLDRPLTIGDVAIDRYSYYEEVRWPRELIEPLLVETLRYAS